MKPWKEYKQGDHINEDLIYIVVAKSEYLNSGIPYVDIAKYCELSDGEYGFVDAFDNRNVAFSPKEGR